MNGMDKYELDRLITRIKEEAKQEVDKAKKELSWATRELSEGSVYREFLLNAQKAGCEVHDLIREEAEYLKSTLSATRSEKST